MITGKDYVDAILFVKKEWGDEVLAVACLTDKRPMDLTTFLNYCTACGGDWGALLLSGVHELYPEVWNMIPDDMGTYAFTTICKLLILLGIDTSKE